MIPLSKKQGPLYAVSRFKDTKDPCPVFDGTIWHIFGSGGSVRDERWKILHAIAPALEGPWVEDDPVELIGMTGNCDHVAAPGVVFEKRNHTFHMFLQTDFTAPNGVVVYLTSKDGKQFKKINTALESIPESSDEVGIYDPHPSVIGKEKYLVYSGMPPVVSAQGKFIPRPDVFLARSKSSTWSGPWERLGKILDHHAIAAHHNQPDDPNYEWGIEGPQLIELPNKQILLNATCFLPQGRFGTRQRTFFAIADQVGGPYATLGPIISENLDEWESGENGHAAGIVDGALLHLFYQARSGKNELEAQANDWRYGIATFDLGSFMRQAQKKKPMVIRIPLVLWQQVQPQSVLRMIKKLFSGDYFKKFGSKK